MNPATDPTSVSSSLDPSQSTEGGSKMVDLADNKPFGALIITRPYLDPDHANQFRVYVINPPIIKAWAAPNPNLILLGSVLNDYRPSQDIKVLHNTNSLKVRVSPDRQLYCKGLSDSWWVENGSGNEFVTTADLWANTP